MKYSLLIGLIGLGWLVSGCDREPVFPVEPQIEFLDIQPREVQQFTDSILVTFRFQDGDGDLGSSDPDDPNLILLDSRFSEGRIANQRDAENTFAIPSLTPEAKNPSIQGEITVKLVFPVVLPDIPLGGRDSVRYQIKFYDRSGNLATNIEDGEEVVWTDYIYITR